MVAAGLVEACTTFHVRTQKLVDRKPEISHKGRNNMQISGQCYFSMRSIDHTLDGVRSLSSLFWALETFCTLFPTLVSLCPAPKQTIPESVASDGVDVRLPLVCFDPVHAEDQGHTVR